MSRRRPASSYAVEMAEAQHRQALAGYWPQINVKGGYQRMDEATGTVIREGVESIVNPLDLYAIATAIELKAGCNNGNPIDL